MNRVFKNQRIWKNITHYKFKSIFIRSVITNILFIAIPLILISSILYWNSVRAVQNEIPQLSQNTLIRNRDIFDSLLKKADYLSASFARMPEVQLFFNPAQVPGEQLPAAQAVVDTLKPFVLTDPHIQSIYIYSEQQNKIITLSGIFPLEDFRDTNWLESYRVRQDEFPYRLSRILFDDYLPTVSVIKPIRQREKGERLGAVVVNLSLNSMSGNIVANEKNEELFILGENREILFSKNLSQIGKSLESIPLGKEFGSLIAYGETVQIFPKIDALLAIAPSARDGSIYMMKVPLEQYKAEFRFIWTMFFLLLLASFLISLFASLILAMKSYRPIDKLLEFVDNPQKAGQIQFQSQEIKEIAASILTTVHLNENLKSELMEQLSLVEETRIFALQAQINPHFLYNTLDAIRWEVMHLSGGDNNVSQMLTALARLLRLSLETSSNITTFKKETEHADLYLKLLNLRYPNKFEVIRDIDPDLNDCLVLKLSLQPLIENAWYHGIKAARQTGKIIIQGRLLRDKVSIKVCDNGQGIPPEKVKELNRIISKDLSLNDHHIGVKNVNQRIKLVFGKEYGLAIKSHHEKGTEVELSFPGHKKAVHP